MRKRFLLGLVGAGIAAQFAAPAWMIARQEWILRNGTRVCFEAVAVDPLDVMRGRYVAIGLAEFERFVECAPDNKTRKYHVTVETNELGVARLARAELPLPERRGLYVTAWAKSWYYNESTRRFENPFNRFYMPEKLAPVAEAMYRESSARRNETNSVLLAVRLHNGRGVVEDLLVNGTPMIKAARARLREQTPR